MTSIINNYCVCVGDKDTLLLYALFLLSFFFLFLFYFLTEVCARFFSEYKRDRTETFNTVYRMVSICGPLLNSVI